MDKDKAKEELKILLERYNRLKAGKETEVKSKEEEKTKTKLVRPLFERVLGWNFEEDVTGEEKVSKGWVDYGFRINDVPKFFLEAKGLRENLDSSTFFQQAYSYAYYKRCAWAVLTNFETIEIINAESEAPYNQYSHMTIKCNEFLDKFDDLWLLSKEGFEKGLLDKLAERFVRRPKRVTFDRQLLDDFTRFRDMLSKNIIKLNQKKQLTEEDLDESVQRILNRLIFIRNCEDRELEEKKLWEAKNEAKVWKKVKEVFAYYDKYYDSKLFTYDLNDPKKVHLCDTLDIEDRVLRDILGDLYQTKDRSVSYDFKIIPANVLGTVYEQYLSHILKKTEKRAVLSENQTHRKEQGVYYTPTYVVDYIVKNTLGELLKGKKINVEQTKVLDPACGSGSFLTKAFDVLNEYYLKTDKDYNQTQLDLETGTTFKRKVNILQNNIFGVDLDKQAVEISQLNLLLKIAEKKQQLPLLEQNIKCGNSLIDDEKLAGDKAFKWEEQFKKIMKEGRFDVVIGNPPYISYYGSDAVKLTDEERTYFKNHYEIVKRDKERLNAFCLFLEKGSKLLKDGGYLGFIVNKTLLVLPSYKNLRKYLIDNFKIVSIVPELDPFDVIVDATVIILQKTKKRGNTKFINYKDLKGNKQDSTETAQKSFLQNPNYELIFRPTFVSALLKKIEEGSVQLKTTFKTSRGVNIGGRAEYFLKEATSNEKTHPYLLGSQNVSRYRLIYPSPKKNDKYNFLFFDLDLENELKKKGATIVLGDENRFNEPKLVINEASNVLTGTYDESNYYCSYSFHTINGSSKEDLKHLLGILNSEL
jgi:type I restriction-modification system DNA methylase subunit